MTDDERIRRALDSLGDGAVTGAAPDRRDVWERTQRRIEAHARRRKLAIGAAATALIAVVGVGTAFAVTSDDDGSPVVAGPPSTVAPTTSSTVVPTTTTTAPAPTTSTPTTVAPLPAPPPTVDVADGPLPPPTGFAGAAEYRTVAPESLGDLYTASASSPRAKVDELVTALRAEPIEGRRDALGVVESVQGNRASVAVRVIGLADDAIGGADTRLYLLQAQPGGSWTVVGAETRELCSRAFDGSLCV